jgi:hypothetical protein
MSIRHEAVRLLEGDEPRTESNIDRIVRGLLVENYTLACEKYAAEYAARPRGDTMSDDLLDEATRLADDYRNLDEGRVLLDLIERVQQAEAARDSWHQAALLTTADLGRVEHERDAARAQLDKVRRLIPTENPELIEAGYGIDSRDVLAILDDKETK